MILTIEQMDGRDEMMLVRTIEYLEFLDLPVTISTKLALQRAVAQWRNLSPQEQALYNREPLQHPRRG